MKIDNQEKIFCSVGILALNSARTIRAALESVKDFGEIIICDGGSSDETVRIAEEYKCKIIFQDKQFKNDDNSIKDFSGVRNQCLNAAVFDWFLYVDSDEVVSSELAEEVRRIIDEKDNKFLIYKIPSKLILDGHIIEYSSSYPGYQYRFFNKKSGAVFVKTIHERIIFDKHFFNIGVIKYPWYIIWDDEEIKEYFEHSKKSISMEILRSRGQGFHQFLQWSIFNNLFTATKIFLKATKNYLLHGFSKSMPVSIEWARIYYHLRLMFEIIKDSLK